MQTKSCLIFVSHLPFLLKLLRVRKSVLEIYIERDRKARKKERESGETILVNERKKMSSETSIHRSWDTFFRHKGKTNYGVDSTYLPRLVGYNLLRVIEWLQHFKGDKVNFVCGGLAANKTTKNANGLMVWGIWSLDNCLCLSNSCAKMRSSKARKCLIQPIKLHSSR